MPETHSCYYSPVGNVLFLFLTRREAKHQNTGLTKFWVRFTARTSGSTHENFHTYIKRESNLNYALSASNLTDPVHLYNAFVLVRLFGLCFACKCFAHAYTALCRQPWRHGCGLTNHGVICMSVSPSFCLSWSASNSLRRLFARRRHAWVTKENWFLLSLSTASQVDCLYCGARG